MLVSPVSGNRYLAVFNISDNPDPLKIQVSLKDLGIDKKCRVTNLWTGESPEFANEVSVRLRPHASGLYKFQRN
jgi:hypothetical protein